MHASDLLSFSALLLIVGARLLALEASLGRSQQSGDVLVFRVGVATRLSTALLMLALSVTIVTRWNSSALWDAIFIALLAVLAAIWMPAVKLTPTAVSKHWWWRTPVKIPWTEVAAIDKSRDGDLHVRSKSGKSILFTRYNVDPSRFESEVKTRAHLTRTLDASAPTSLSI
ncbi:MAG TPA: hypothetical protein VKS01_05740 [Bryobacteraceae bacterium]|nr:hypothetical protein [Bryobacteraceae bacterium]